MLHNLGNPQMSYLFMFPLRLALQIIFQTVLPILEKWIYLQNYSKNFWFSLAVSLAGLLVYNFIILIEKVRLDLSLSNFMHVSLIPKSKTMKNNVLFTAF